MRFSKYFSRITVIDGIKFHSRREAQRYAELKLHVKAGNLVSFERQVPFVCAVNDVKVCTYYADFVTYSKDGQRTVEDVKGFRTDIYKLKKKLVEALYGIKIMEIK